MLNFFFLNAILATTVFKTRYTHQEPLLGLTNYNLANFSPSQSQTLGLQVLFFGRDFQKLQNCWVTQLHPASFSPFSYILFALRARLVLSCLTLHN